MKTEIATKLLTAVMSFADWLESYGEISQDHQDFFASNVGRAAKRLYYRHPRIGILGVAPMVFCEAFVPSARKLFFPRMRLPIADAHYAMAFALLHQVTGQTRFLQRARHFLGILEATRCQTFERHAWGYPFDWETQAGVLPAGTPLITTTPYCYRAYESVLRLTGQQEFREVLRSIADHVLCDYKDIPTREGAATCTYTPHGGERVVNASAYRASLLFQAHREFGESGYMEAAKRNLNFVLDCQRSDGSWPYAVDGKRGFVDHFHTCFVMKSLAEIESLALHPECSQALARGIQYYVTHLFDASGLPRPFARAPRLTVYRQELYDYAECLNLNVLLRGRFPEFDRFADATLDDVLKRWIQRGGCFRGRKLLVGWDDVPMHRWGQSQMFRSLCLLLQQTTDSIESNDADLQREAKRCAE